jgi:hypothetical protein
MEIVDCEFVSLSLKEAGSLQAGALIELSRTTAFAHKTRTGASFSEFRPKDRCHLCGKAVVYAFLYCNTRTNSYFLVGNECLPRLIGSNAGTLDFFLLQLEQHNHILGRKQMALTYLSSHGLRPAWDIYVTMAKAPVTFSDSKGATRYEESTIDSIVAKLVQFGSISDKQVAFLRSLLAKISTRASRQAEQDEEREQEKASSLPAPTGRVSVKGEIVSCKTQQSAYGAQLKILVKAEGGYKVWMTAPRSLHIERGAQIACTVTLAPTQNDPSFAYGTHPVLN